MLRVEMRIRGQLGTHWSSRFEGVMITHTSVGSAEQERALARFQMQ